MKENFLSKRLSVRMFFWVVPWIHDFVEYIGLSDVLVSAMGVMGCVFGDLERLADFFAKRKEVEEEDCLARGEGGELTMFVGCAVAAGIFCVDSKCVTVARGELLLLAMGGALWYPPRLVLPLVEG